MLQEPSPMGSLTYSYKFGILLLHANFARWSHTTYFSPQKVEQSRLHTKNEGIKRKEARFMDTSVNMLESRQQLTAAYSNPLIHKHLGRFIYTFIP